MKRTVLLALRVLLLVVAYFVCFSVLAGLILPAPAGSAADSASVLPALLAICLINSAVISYVVLWSHWSGWKLTLTLAFVLFGVLTFMPQIETAVFVHNLPPGMLPRLIVFGLVFALVFAPLSVLILGKMRSKQTSNVEPGFRLSTTQWAIRLIVIAVVYVVIYFTFGYFIAWRSPAVRAYYGGTDPGSFLSQMLNVLRETPWLVALQLLRGMLWAVLAVPIIRMTRGSWWAAALAVALLFGVLMNTQLLLPNPLMPYDVRMAHLLETSTSNFLFGILIGWILRK